MYYHACATGNGRVCSTPVCFACYVKFVVCYVSVLIKLTRPINPNDKCEVPFPANELTNAIFM